MTRIAAMHFEKQPLNLSIRSFVGSVLVLFAFILLAGRLWYLQIIYGNYYREHSEENRLETLYQQAPRGVVLDRHGERIVENRPSYQIEINPEMLVDRTETFSILAQLLKEKPSIVEARYEKRKKRLRRYESVVVAEDIDRNTVGRFVAKRHQLKGVVITVKPTRNYLFEGLAPQVLGYVRQISPEQLREEKFAGYLSSEMVGQSGIEKQWEELLQGKRGVRRVIVNALGVRVGELSSEEEIIGNTVQLTIDRSIQQAAERAMTGKNGSVVAMDPHTGEILAIASSPSYNPNIFSTDLSQGQWSALMTERRLTNRAYQGVYPPGSVFKIFLAIAGLQEGVITTKERINCPGYYSFRGRAYRCWKKSGHGMRNLHQALVSSCDVYFYVLGQRLGIDKIKAYSDMFGLGRKTGVQIPGEQGGLIPSREWKKKYFRKKEDQTWYQGETLSVAIGQGAVGTTPLQIARSLSAVVNGGRVLTPVITHKVVSTDGRVLHQAPQQNSSGVDVEEHVLAKVIDALVGVVHEPGGTGARARLPEFPEVKVGGKTGTAQVVALEHHGKKRSYEDHAWFAGFAPAENPEIVVAALVEHGGHGGSSAAPIAQQVMTAFFKRKERMSQPEKELE